MNIQIQKDGKTLNAGKADLDRGVYYSYRQDKMYKFNGFAISKCILDYLKSMSVYTIVCSGLIANTLDYYSCGKEWIDGNDEQLVLNLAFFEELPTGSIVTQEKLW